MSRLIFLGGVFFMFLTSITAAQTTQPTIKEMPAMELAGIATFGTPAHGLFAKLWGNFPGNVEKQPGISDEACAYGVSLVVPTMEKNKDFSYFAGKRVTDASKVPAFLLRLPVPPGTYAIFPLQHGMPDGLKEMGPMFDYIFNVWMPDSEYEMSAPLNIERYDSKAHTIELLIPVRKRK